MNSLYIILAKTTAGAIAEIIILLLIAGAIAYLTAYFYHKAVYMKKINALEEEKSALQRKVGDQERTISELNNKVAELEKK
jgi:Tfp pilus assembly protein PilO